MVSCYVFAKKGKNQYGRGKGVIERGQAGRERSRAAGNIVELGDKVWESGPFKD